MHAFAVVPSGHSDTVAFVVLSRREKQIIRLICEGMGNKAIAWKLGLQPSTVSSYLARLSRRLQISTRLEICLWALQRPQILRIVPGGRPGLHQPGCECGSVYCTAMRVVDSDSEQLRPAA